jgi:hypothetical protein
MPHPSYSAIAALIGLLVPAVASAQHRPWSIGVQIGTGNTADVVGVEQPLRLLELSGEHEIGRGWFGQLIARDIRPFRAVPTLNCQQAAADESNCALRRFVLQKGFALGVARYIGIGDHVGIRAAVSSGLVRASYKVTGFVATEKNSENATLQGAIDLILPVSHRIQLTLGARNHATLNYENADGKTLETWALTIGAQRSSRQHPSRTRAGTR